jgi:hypothetical protein
MILWKKCFKDILIFTTEPFGWKSFQKMVKQELHVVAMIANRSGRNEQSS